MILLYQVDPGWLCLSASLPYQSLRVKSMYAEAIVELEKENETNILFLKINPE
ncbi:MAG TPA: hypothetical protein VF762_14875 [Blastocatellia bacterium]